MYLVDEHIHLMRSKQAFDFYLELPHRIVLVYVQSPLPEIAAMIADNVCVLALRENGDLLLNDIEVFACMRK